MENSSFEAGLREIKMIRSGLSEREFYHRIVDAFHKMGTGSISEQDIQRLRVALSEKGCGSYKDFLEKKKKSGEQVEQMSLIDSIETGHIVGAASMVHQIFCSNSSAAFALQHMNHGYDQSYTSIWLRKSERKLDMEEYYRKKSEDLERYNAQNIQTIDDEGR